MEAALQRAAQAELAVCFYENEEQRTFRAAIESARFRTAALLTGPEGGLERSEVEQAQRAGLAVSARSAAASCAVKRLRCAPCLP